MGVQLKQPNYQSLVERPSPEIKSKTKGGLYIHTSQYPSRLTERFKSHYVSVETWSPIEKPLG